MKLNPAQETILSDIRAAKEKFDEDAAYLKRAYTDSLNALKNPIRALATKALEAGVPVRLIHKNGLGFEQVNSMRSFLETQASATRAIADMLVPVPENPGALGSLLGENVGAISGSESAASGSKQKIDYLGNDKYRYIDPDGEEWFAYYMGETTGNVIQAGSRWRDDLEEEILNFVPEWREKYDSVWNSGGISIDLDDDEEEEDN